MNSSTRFVLAFLAIALVISVVHVIRGVSHGPDPVDTVAARTALDPDPVLPPDPKSEALKRARVAVLEKQADYREKARRAAAQTASARSQAAAQIQPSWTAFIQTNRAKYSALVEQAHHDPHGSAHCTLCNGVGDLACIMCTQHNGKCLSCGGSGLGRYLELCPTCNGSGKCYLCAGLGRMNCAFCNDGVIAIDTPPPPASAPIH